MRHLPALTVPLLVCALATPASACGPTLPPFIVYAILAGPVWLLALTLFGLLPRRVRGTARWVAIGLMLFFCAAGPMGANSFEAFVAVAALPIAVPLVLAACAGGEPRARDAQPMRNAKWADPRPRRPAPAPQITAMQAIRVVAQTGGEGRCPVCSTPATGSIRECVRCSTPHHADGSTPVFMVIGAPTIWAHGVIVGACRLHDWTSCGRPMSVSHAVGVRP